MSHLRELNTAACASLSAGGEYSNAFNYTVSEHILSVTRCLTYAAIGVRARQLMPWLSDG